MSLCGVCQWFTVTLATWIPSIHLIKLIMSSLSRLYQCKDQESIYQNIIHSMSLVPHTREGQKKLFQLNSQTFTSIAATEDCKPGHWWDWDWELTDTRERKWKENKLTSAVWRRVTNWRICQITVFHFFSSRVSHSSSRYVSPNSSLLCY